MYIFFKYSKKRKPPSPPEANDSHLNLMIMIPLSITRCGTTHECAFCWALYWRSTPHQQRMVENRNLNLIKPQIHRKYRRQRNKLDTHKEADSSGCGMIYRAVAQVSISQWCTDKIEEQKVLLQIEREWQPKEMYGPMECDGILI